MYGIYFVRVLSQMEAIERADDEPIGKSAADYALNFYVAASIIGFVVSHRLSGALTRILSSGDDDDPGARVKVESVARRHFGAAAWSAALLWLVVAGCGDEARQRFQIVGLATSVDRVEVKVVGATSDCLGGRRRGRDRRGLARRRGGDGQPGPGRLQAVRDARGHHGRAGHRLPELQRYLHCQIGRRLVARGLGGVHLRQGP